MRNIYNNQPVVSQLMGQSKVFTIRSPNKLPLSRQGVKFLLTVYHMLWHTRLLAHPTLVHIHPRMATPVQCAQYIRGQHNLPLQHMYLHVNLILIVERVHVIGVQLAGIRLGMSIVIELLAAFAFLPLPS